MIKYTFKQHLMLEGIRLTPSTYGTDESTNNRQVWKYNDPSNFLETLISDNNNYYLIVIQLDTGEVKFLGCDHYSTNMSDYTTDRLSTSNPLRLMGKIFYVVAVLVQKYNLSSFKFTGADAKLTSMYSTIVNNKDFNYQMNQIHLFYIGNDNNMFTYEYRK